MITRLLIAIACIFGATPASALTVSPVHVELSSTGSRNRAQITVINNSNLPLPIEAVLMEASFDELGRATTTKAGEDFLIMPPQALIPPNSTQNFRIQWLGNPVIDKSRSYMLYFSQVPVRDPSRKAIVQIVMSIGVLINVAPPQGSPTLVVESSAIETDRRGQRHPSITVRNPTNVHAQLRQTTIKLEQGGWSAALHPSTIEQTIGIGLVQPGRRRRFVLPIALPAGQGPLRVRVETMTRR